MKRTPSKPSKPKTVIMKKHATLWATKNPKAKSPPAFMPAEVAVRLEGDPGLKGLLIVSGWTTSPSQKWPKARLEANLDRLTEGWAEEVGKGWTLSIR